MTVENNSAVGQKGIVFKAPPESVEIHTGMELVVAGELADMWLVERYDGHQAYIPKDCFTLFRDAKLRDHLTDLMSQIDEVIRVAEYQEKSEMVEHLQTLKERFNDLSMDIDE
jgi:hypothetical protein